MPTPVRYAVDLRDRARHLVTVTMAVPDDVAGPVELVMPTWTPGSYVMRDYVHHVQQVHARDDLGHRLPVVANSHTSWTVDAPGPFTVTWELYANSMTVRTNHVDDHHALLVAPATFITISGVRDRAHRVCFDAGEVVHGMLARDGDDHVAPTLDLLMDAAFEVEGTTPFPTATVAVDGIDHRFVWAGHGGAPDLDDIAATMDKIAVATRDLLDDRLPQPAYTFLCTGFDGGSGGGLEHRDGSVLLTPITATATEAGRARLQSLIAHEYLHLANVKRMVPAELVAPSLTRHVHSPSLWVAEGWTHYYDAVLPSRAGLWDVDRLLETLSGRIAAMQDRPGARLQSVADASWSAWTKLYVRDENSANAGTDYYGHGGLLAWCLDLLIRRADPGSDGLDDALRGLWRRFGDTSALPPTVGYRPEDVVAAVSDAAGRDLTAFFDAHVTGLEPPPVAELVGTVGLEVQAHVADDAPPRLGVTTRDDDHGTTIASVQRWGPAWEAGITGGDRLLAVDGLRVEPRSLDAVLRMHAPGATVDVTVFSGPRLRTLPVTLGEPTPTPRLRPVTEPDDRQRAAFRSWSGQDLPADAPE